MVAKITKKYLNSATTIAATANSQGIRIIATRIAAKKSTRETSSDMLVSITPLG